MYWVSKAWVDSFSITDMVSLSVAADKIRPPPNIIVNMACNICSAYKKSYSSNNRFFRSNDFWGLNFFLLRNKMYKMIDIISNKARR